MYDRKIGDRELTFEASGGLVNGTLVLQDRETDSYWPIMQAKSFHGELAGTKMREMAINDKVTWKEWRTRHPDTQVLSVNGLEDKPKGYEKYFASPNGFRGLQASDKRLATKEPIFAFRLAEQSFAVRLSEVEGGGLFDLPEGQIFLYRGKNADLFESTVAYVGDAISSSGADWVTTHNACRFDSNTRSFVGQDCPERVSGFDTFWYSWSLNNPDTQLLSR